MSNAAGDYANLLAMISSGWGGQVTPYDAGLDLGPQEVGQAFKQGTSDLNARRKTQADYDIGRWNAQNEANKTEAGMDIAADTNQLGYAKLGSGEEVARIGQEGKIGAAQARGALNAWQMAEQEKGRDARSNAQIQSRMEMKNQDLAMRQLLADKGIKFPSGDVFAQLIMNAKQEAPKATPEELQILAMRYWVQMNDALQPKYRQDQGTPQQGTQQQSTPPAEPGITKSPQEWAEGNFLNRRNLPSYPGRAWNWLTSNPSE